jgi:putative ABC transport system permease protein
MLSLALKNLVRRPLRALLTAIGLAVSVGLLACLLSFGEGYQRSLHRELDGMGMQLMLVPLGCPYDAAAQVLKGHALDVTLPASALDAARRDPAVAVAAPVYAATLPRPDLGRTDLWMGVDESTRQMRPWWRLTPGSSYFTSPDSVLLGAEAAMTELRKPGDKFYSPETGRTFTVCGVLERSGTSDDSQFFVPLATAQAMFHQPGKLTAVMIRLKDPALLAEASDRLQQVKGAQVVTLTEMMGTFLNLMGAARSLILAIAVVALCISALSVFNTMMAATLERTRELGVLRAIGFGRRTIFGLMALESLALALVGGLTGLILAALAGRGIEQTIRPYVPLAPEAGLPLLTAAAAAECLLLMVGVGALAGAYPAWRASRLKPAVALDVE